MSAFFKKIKFSNYANSWFLEFYNSWKELFKIFLSRFFEGLKKSNFVIYFLVIIVFVGGFGVLKTLHAIIIDSPSSTTDPLYLNFSKSLSTYFIAIIASSTADLILNKEPNLKEAQILRMPSIAALVIGGFLIFLIQMEITEISYELAISGTILAWFIWWIANSMDPKHEDPVADGINPNSTLGGNPQKSLDNRINNKDLSFNDDESSNVKGVKF